MKFYWLSLVTVCAIGTPLYPQVYFPEAVSHDNPLTTVGQKLKFEHISIEDGLSQGTVNAVIQDAQGFLWFGTEDGLNRYNGYAFKIFKHDPDDANSLSNNFIWTLGEDHSGNLWVGTDGGGLNKFDPESETFTRYLHNPRDSTSLSDDSVQCIFVDSGGTVWIGTWGGGLNKYVPETNSFKRYSVRTNKVWAILQDSRGELWLGTDGAGLAQLEPASETFNYYVPDSERQIDSVSVVVTSIVEDRNDDLWIGTYGSGLCKFNYAAKTFAQYRHDPDDPHSISEDVVWALHEDSQGILWVGTMSQGADMFDRQPEHFIHHKSEKSGANTLSTNYIRTIFEDRSGVMWIGTMVGGLNKLDRKAPKFFHVGTGEDTAENLAHDFIFTICEDRQGDLWVGTYGGGISRYDIDKGRFTHYKHDPQDTGSLSSDQVRIIYADSKGTLWVGTYFGGLNKYVPETDAFIRYRHDPNDETGLSNEEIRTIFEDREGVLWIGTNGGGLNQFEPESETFIHYRYQESDATSLSNDHVLAINEDQYGRLWIGTYGGGLNIFDKEDGRFTRYQHDAGDSTALSNDVVTEIFVDSKRQLWLGTWGGGVNKAVMVDKNSQSLSDLKFHHYREKEGLSGNIVAAILEDESGSLWIGTNKGMTRLNPTTGAFRNFDFSDGLMMDGFNPGAKCKSKNGWMYFGGVDGINFFHPDRVQDNPYIPPLVISSFKIFETPVPLQPTIAFAEALSLSYKDRFFSFELAALDYTNPERNKYAYMLEGFDPDWVYSGTRRYVSYTNLSPGEYVFKARGSNNDEVWNDTGVSLKINIAPPFWETWWFRMLVFAGIAGTLGAFYHYRMSNLKKEKAAQEEFSRQLIGIQEKERKRIASELHDSLGQNLLVINSGLKQCIGRAPGKELAQELVQLSEATLQSINEVREISSNLHPHQVERLGLKKAIEAMADRLSQTSELQFDLNLQDIQSGLTKDDQVSIYRIIQEATNNIIKHSAADTVHITLTQNEHFLHLSIRDDGSGFDIPVSLREGKKGFGLTNISERVKILKGQFRIESVPGQGTTLNIKLPSRRTQSA